MVWKCLCACKVILSRSDLICNDPKRCVSCCSRIEPDFPDTSAALQPLTGKLYTYLPVKQMFLFFVFIFEIGSLLCAVSTSSMFFILGRTVAGLGSSGLENGALNLIAGAVPPHKRPCKSQWYSCRSYGCEANLHLSYAVYNGVVFGGQ